MYVLVNKAGNAEKHAETEAKRDQLLALGYVPVEEKPKQTRRRNNGNGRHQTADEGKTAPEQDSDEGKTAPEQDADEGKTAPEQDADEATEDDQETEADEE